MVDESGNYPYNPMKTVQNSYDQTRTRQLNLNTYLTWDIIKNLTFKATFNYTWRQDVRRTFYNSDTYQGDPKYSASGVNGNFSDKDRNSWSQEIHIELQTPFRRSQSGRTSRSFSFQRPHYGDGSRFGTYHMGKPRFLGIG